MAKRVKIEETVDRITSLPDSILAHILSYLPTNVAVGTCILLTRSRWRDIFPFFNKLDFDQSLVNYNPNSASPFVNFVDRCIMLKNGTASIDKFRLKCSNVVDTLRIHSWICAALCSNVRELDLSIGRKLGKKFSCVFTCNTLVVLKLGVGSSLNVPASVYFPCLKTLHLESIRIACKDSPIQRLVSSSPVLEDLLLVGSYMENVVNLSSPSLKRFTIDKPYHDRSYQLVLDTPSLIYLRLALCIGKGHILKNLRSLREAHIGIPYWAHHQLIFEGLDNVESLHLSGQVRQFLRDVSEEIPLFQNLTRLVLTDGPYLEMFVLMKLLQFCPNLEELVTDGSIRGGYDVPCCVPSRLKSIECALFCNNRGATNHEEVESLEYFFNNANILEKVHIRWYSTLHPREATEKLETVMETIRKLAKASCRSKTYEIKVFR